MTGPTPDPAPDSGIMGWLRRLFGRPSGTPKPAAPPATSRLRIGRKPDRPAAPSAPARPGRVETLMTEPKPRVDQPWACPGCHTSHPAGTRACDICGTEAPR